MCVVLSNFVEHSLTTPYLLTPCLWKQPTQQPKAPDVLCVLNKKDLMKRVSANNVKGILPDPTYPPKKSLHFIPGEWWTSCVRVWCIYKNWDNAREIEISPRDRWAIRRCPITYGECGLRRCGHSIVVTSLSNLSPVSCFTPSMFTHAQGFVQPRLSSRDLSWLVTRAQHAPLPSAWKGRSAPDGQPSALRTNGTYVKQ